MSLRLKNDSRRRADTPPTSVRRLSGQDDLIKKLLTNSARESHPCTPKKVDSKPKRCACAYTPAGHRQARSEGAADFSRQRGRRAMSAPAAIKKSPQAIYCLRRCGANKGNRTPVLSLGSGCFTIKLYSPICYLSYHFHAKKSRPHVRKTARPYLRADSPPFSRFPPYFRYLFPSVQIACLHDSTG